MSYIWINPVIDSMYDAYVLDEFLRRHGHKRIEVTKDWGSIVKEKYRKAVHQSADAVADVRCPAARRLLEQMDISGKISIPDINPILIHCGQEISERIDLQGEEKIITTPCLALADMGNALELPETRFIPWNRFVEMLGQSPKGNSLMESPIPPGFFDELSVKTVSITGEEGVREYFENGIPDEVKLIEMLLCKGGCHNGDGVRFDE